MVLHRWLERLRTFDPSRYRSCQAEEHSVYRALAGSPSPPVLLHRDFYGKQALIDRQGRVGLLDFDTLAVGEAALDLANALVHLELRGLQQHCSPRTARTAAIGLLEGYRPGRQVRRRVQAYADASRLRLACVYAFRPPEAFTVSALLAQVGQPILEQARVIPL
jgi:aminoglycoside phosphotransferase (APT) family kinase protein